MESENIAEAREPAAASKPAAPAANWPASKPWAETGHQRGHQNQMKKYIFPVENWHVSTIAESLKTKQI